MRKDKRLTSETPKSKSTKNDKRLTTDSQDSGRTVDEKKLTAEESPARAKAPVEVEPQGITLKERIRNSTLAGGLRKLPPNFEDMDGDWIICKSNDPFERLYLNYKEYKSITPEMVERNYNIINDFWREKIQIMNTGANKVKIIRKYAGEDGSERTILRYKNSLKKAHDLLAPQNGIEKCYYELEERRQKMIRSEIEPFIMLALKDKILEPAEEVDIRNYCRSKTDLSEEEIDELIEEYLNKTGSRRGEGGSSIAQSEKVFFNLIKIKLNDKLLSAEDEQELLATIEDSHITSQRYEDLVLAALREIDGSEREKTFEQDKQIFYDFYYGLLRDFSLNNDEYLPEPAIEKLIQRENSETEFFPLSQQTIKGLTEETINDYKANLQTEKQEFFENAIKNLDRYDGHVEAKQEMMDNTQYSLLLPAMRQELTAEAIRQIIDKQSNKFTEAAKKYYQLKNWTLNEEQIDEFITVPNQLPHCKNLRYDWLDKEARESLFEDVTQWAEEQHQNEITVITEQVSKELKKHIYGLPVDLQKKFENDSSYYLEQTERREIITILEKPHRKNAEKVFTDLVSKALIYETLIPEVEDSLLEKGKNELFLTQNKNSVSFKVKTTEEIISSLRKPFDSVLNKQVKEIATRKRMDDKLIRQYNLPYKAYISQTDVDKFINEYKPANTQEFSTIEKIFKSYSKEENLYIVPRQNLEEFARVLEQAVESSSKSYRFGLKRWLNSKFVHNMVKVGAAYGVAENVVKKEIKKIKLAYPKWTLPNWKPLILTFLAITGSFISLRGLISLTGYRDWILNTNIIRHYGQSPSSQTIDFDTALLMSELDGYWGIGAILLTIIALSLVFTQKKKKIRLMRFHNLLLLILAYFFGKKLSIITAAVLIVVFRNIGIFLINLFKYLWYLLQNAWAYIIAGVSYLDRLVYIMPMDPIIAWGIFGGSIGFLIAFLISVKGKRRSYLKPNLSIATVAIIFLSVITFTSINKSRRDFPPPPEQPSTTLYATINNERGANIREKPTKRGKVITALPKGHELVILSQEGSWYHINFNQYNKKNLNGYVYKTLVDTTRTLPSDVATK